MSLVADTVFGNKEVKPAAVRKPGADAGCINGCGWDN